MGGYFMFALPAFGHLIIQPNINIFYKFFFQSCWSPIDDFC